MNDVTVVIPTIPPRAKMLKRALLSVVNQTLAPAAIVVEYDHERTGAAATKNRGISKATTEWLAMLDDDDQFLPNHLESLVECAARTGADVVYPWPLMNGGGDPRPDRAGKPFDPDELRRGSYIPTTVLARTDLVTKVGGFQVPDGSLYDDWGLFLALLDADARFVHLPQQTWIWNIHGGNTSGQSDRY